MIFTVLQKIVKKFTQVGSLHEAIPWFRTITSPTTWWWNEWGSTSASSYYHPWLGTLDLSIPFHIIYYIIHICIHMYMYVLYASIRIFMNTCMCIYIFVFTFVYLYYVYLCLYVYIYVYILICIYIYIWVCISEISVLEISMIYFGFFLTKNLGGSSSWWWLESLASQHIPKTPDHSLE